MNVENLLKDRKRGCSGILIDALDLLVKVEKEDKNKAINLAEKIAKVHESMAGLVKTLKLIKTKSAIEIKKEVEKSNYFSALNLSKFLNDKNMITISRSGIVEKSIMLSNPAKIYVLISRPGK